MEEASAVLSLLDDPAILRQIIATRTRERDEVSRQGDETNCRRDEPEIEAL